MLFLFDEEIMEIHSFKSIRKLFYSTMIASIEL